MKMEDIKELLISNYNKNHETKSGDCLPKKFVVLCSEPQNL
jgi:hypothetical protein